MSLRKMLAKLDELNATTSTNDKVELLKEFLKNAMFSRVVKYALDGTLHYGIKKFPEFKEAKFPKCENRTRKIFELLDSLAKAKGASDPDKDELFRYSAIDTETVEVVRRIVNKDLRCGVSGSLINKAKPGMLRIMPYQRCSTEKKMDNLKFDNDSEVSLPNVIAQEKADGMFANVMINKLGQIKILTRNGKVVLQLKKLKEAILSQKPKTQYGAKRGILNDPKGSCLSHVFMGELVVIKKGKILPRQIGNGILNSCIQGTADQKDADCVCLRMWDCVPLDKFWEGEYNQSYSDRLYQAMALRNIVDDTNRVEVVDTQYVHSLEEAKDFYSVIRKKGGEGAILKDRTVIWKSHTSPMMIKMKNVMDVELVLVGWYKGKKGKKYENCVGGLTVETACGKLRVNLGTGIGLSDEFRGYYPIKDKFGKIIDPMVIDMDKAENACDHVEMQEGAIVQCECESVIKSKTKDTHSLFLPRFVEFRFDKDEADTLKDLLER